MQSCRVWDSISHLDYPDKSWVIWFNFAKFLHVTSRKLSHSKFWKAKHVHRFSQIFLKNFPIFWWMVSCSCLFHAIFLPQKHGTLHLQALRTKSRRRAKPRWRRWTELETNIFMLRIVCCSKMLKAIIAIAVRFWKMTFWVASCVLQKRCEISEMKAFLSNNN